MKRRPYHVNPALQTWEEKNYLKLMSKKIQAARSTVPKARGKKSSFSDQAGDTATPPLYRPSEGPSKVCVQPSGCGTVAGWLGHDRVSPNEQKFLADVPLSSYVSPAKHVSSRRSRYGGVMPPEDFPPVAPAVPVTIPALPPLPNKAPPVPAAVKPITPDSPDIRPTHMPSPPMQLSFANISIGITQAGSHRGQGVLAQGCGLPPIPAAHSAGSPPSPKGRVGKGIASPASKAPGVSSKRAKHSVKPSKDSRPPNIVTTGGEHGGCIGFYGQAELDKASFTGVQGAAIKPGQQQDSSGQLLPPLLNALVLDEATSMAAPLTSSAASFLMHASSFSPLRNSQLESLSPSHPSFAHISGQKSHDSIGQNPWADRKALLTDAEVLNAEAGQQQADRMIAADID
ncbi:hypothetical protein WJX79_001823 [Trebouxia sp. C0005]